MKKIFLVVAAMLVSATMAFSQSSGVAYMYSEQVFKAMPEYTEAIKALDAYADEAAAVAESLLAQVQEKYIAYKKEEQYLSDASKEAARNEIVALEKEANTYEDEFFEQGGAMDKKKQELMLPLETKVREAVDKISEAKGYDIVLDLSVAQVAIYKKANLDITQDVIDLVVK